MALFPELQQLIDNIDQQLAVASKGGPMIAPLEEQREEAHRYLLVTAGELRLAVAIADLAEVGQLPPVTFLPNLPPWIYGVTNMRGEVVSVINLPMFLGQADARSGEGDKLVVVHGNKRKVGFRIHRLVATVSRGKSELEPLVDKTPLYDQSFFQRQLRHGDETYVLLASSGLLSAPRLIDYNRRTRE